MKISRPVLLVGCGGMAADYARVLRALGTEPEVIGRRPEACATFAQKTGLRPREGGIDAAVAAGVSLPPTAIVAVNVDQLAPVTGKLITAGVRRILVEKPGGLHAREIAELARLATEHRAEVFVAYNRRFYASALQARELIAADGGATSLLFEFTEWSHQITGLPLGAAIKREWFLANSTHVCDLAFFLGGFPTALTAYSRGSLDWHPSGAQFTGCGVTTTGAVFAYHSNWESAGRWGVEVCTAKRRLYLRPMETLQEQLRGELALRPVALDDQPDKDFKPGLHAQTEAFLRENEAAAGLLTLGEQARHTAEIYRRMVPVQD